jgi:hypothetical protein
MQSGIGYEVELEKFRIPAVLNLLRYAASRTRSYLSDASRALLHAAN